MSWYDDYSPLPISGKIIGFSCVGIVAALPLIGFSAISKPAHPATRGTRIAWYLTGLAALLQLSSLITPLVVAIRYVVHPEPEPVIRGGDRDLGPVSFALIGLALIFEIAACRSVFYATLPLGVTRGKKWTFVILDAFSFGGLVGTMIGALVGTESYDSGLCGSPCTSPREVAAVFFDNTNTSGGMHITSLFSLIVVLAGAIAAKTWSPNCPLAHSLRIWVPILAVLQIAITLGGIFTWITTESSESWDKSEWDSIYYAMIPFTWVQLAILWFVQIALRRNYAEVQTVTEAAGIALKEQPARSSEPTVTA